MFDIGFSELVVIGAVALVVIGPEELPRVARTAGHLMGRLRRYVNDIKSDISKEIEISEFKRMQEDLAQSARELQDSFTRQTEEIKQSVAQQAREIEEIGAEVRQVVATPEVASGEAPEPAVESLGGPTPSSGEISQEKPVKPARSRKRANAADASVATDPIAASVPEMETAPPAKISRTLPAAGAETVVPVAVASSVEDLPDEAPELVVNENQLDLFGAKPQNKG